MLCCKGSKSPSKPASRGASKPNQNAATPTLLSDQKGAAADKIVIPIKEPLAASANETAAPVAPDVDTQPENLEQQHQSQDVEQFSSTLGVSGGPDKNQSAYTNAASSGTHSSGLLRKQRTVVVDKNDLDVMVVEYACHDSSVLTALGKHSKEAKWKVQVGYDTTPVDIRLHVDQGVVSGPAVQVTSNGKSVFKTAGSYTKKAMYDDFEHRWPFRGTIKGMSEPGMFELRPHALAAAEEWFPATISGQREDGLFEVVAMMPDNAGGFNQVSYPAVDKADLREAGTSQPLQIPSRCLTLQVPRDEPLQACLSLDGKDLVTHHFARPSPCLVSDDDSRRQKLELLVTKDRSIVTGNVGHSVLSHFVTGEVQAVSSDAQTLRHAWTIQVGPFAEHTVVVEKHHRLSNIISLTVDGQPFVEASAEDIDCHTGGWECKFRFIGEKIIDFEVHESNRDGATLDSKDHVLQKKKYVHECCVTVGEDLNMRTAAFTIDSNDFRQLPVRSQPHEEEHISISPEALNLTYGILVPYKVNREAPCGIFGLSASRGGASKMGRRIKTMCCC